ncbi:hypothetical protein J6590_056149 [Homalodisca vitripennis]|nr:hypothetical protein J6590_056149 [Homalodisca vitripennis]
MLEERLQQPCISVTFKTCICLSCTEGAIKFQPLKTLPPVISPIELWTPQVCTRELQSGCTTLLYRLSALDSVDVKFVRNPLLWLFKNPVDFIKSYVYDRPWNGHHHCRSVRACTEAHLIIIIIMLELLKAEVAGLRQQLSLVNRGWAQRADELEQYQRRDNLRVFGVKEEQGEDTDEMMVKLFTERLGVSVSLADID